jgi:signal transduction histidine kinase
VRDTSSPRDSAAAPEQAQRSRLRSAGRAGQWPWLPVALPASEGFTWPWPTVWLDVAWAIFSAANLACILLFARWETIPFHFIWISLTLLYGFRVWPTRPTLWVLGVVMLTTFAAISVDVWRGAQSVDELNEVPLMAMMFWLMVWHAQRRLDADRERDLVSEENARLLATQRRFLQDASHQLRTPITIALGHAELLAQELTERAERRDIQVVVGELARLRRLGERLLVIAASEDPDFLRPERIALDRFTMEVIRRWRPTADRQWRIGRLDRVTISADRERLALAVDALLENAVRHTSSGDTIQLSVLSDAPAGGVRMIVADTGAGILPGELAHIFDRFRTGSPPGGTVGSTATKGTGLGLPLVRAVAHAHGGEVQVHSIPGQGSEFELVLPAPAAGPVTFRPAIALSRAAGPAAPARMDAEG